MDTRYNIRIELSSMGGERLVIDSQDHMGFEKSGMGGVGEEEAS